MPNRYKQPISDTDRLHIMAHHLGISEFALFQMAYQAWYHKECTAKRMERYFVQYLYFSEVPFWMRHLLRTMDAGIVYGAGREQWDKHRIITTLLFLRTWMLPYRCLRKRVWDSRFGITV